MGIDLNGLPNPTIQLAECLSTLFPSLFSRPEFRPPLSEDGQQLNVPGFHKRIETTVEFPVERTVVIWFESEQLPS